ncbi:hypothetical protein ElyMa_006598000 [Elysia marginata]|uniref:Uncharacterized protein n=1 Tax=Elysia marginata TaxID=1093978 RepID=A0AAV4IDY0_9GAST|nr:hypothetical protein ElyMa_006598000 [Elysia marginata]
MNSLFYFNLPQKTAEYLTMQLNTFPSEKDIVQIVKDYMGDVPIPDSGILVQLDDDDDDDDGHGGGGSGGSGGGGGFSGTKKSGGGTGSGQHDGPGGAQGGRGGNSDGGSSGGNVGEGGGGGSGRGGASAVDPRLPRSKSFTLSLDASDDARQDVEFVPNLVQIEQRENNSLSISSSGVDVGQQQQQQQQHRQNPTLRPITVAALPPSINSTVCSATPTQPFIQPENEAVVQNQRQGPESLRARTSVIPSVTVNGAPARTANTATAATTVAPSAGTAIPSAMTTAVSAMSSATTSSSLHRRPDEMLTSSSQLDLTTDTTLGSTLTNSSTANTSERDEVYYYDGEEDDGEGENWMDGDGMGLSFIENALHDFLLQYNGEEPSDGAATDTVVGDDRRILAYQPLPGTEEAGDVALNVDILEAEGDYEDTVLEELQSLSLITRPTTPSIGVDSTHHTTLPALSSSNITVTALGADQSSASLTITSDETLTSTAVTKTSKREEFKRMKLGKRAQEQKTSGFSQQTYPPLRTEKLSTSLVKTLQIDKKPYLDSNTFPANAANAFRTSTVASGSKVAAFSFSEKDCPMKVKDCQEITKDTKWSTESLDKSEIKTEENSESETVFNVCENASVNRTSFLSTEELFKDLKLSRIFYSLRDSVMESSVDGGRIEATADSILEFPILDGNAWDPGNVDRYMNVRSARDSCVDVRKPDVTNAGSSNSFDLNRNRSMSKDTRYCDGSITPIVYNIAACSTSRTDLSSASLLSSLGRAKKECLDTAKHNCPNAANICAMENFLRGTENDAIYFCEIHTLCDSIAGKSKDRLSLLPLHLRTDSAQNSNESNETSTPDQHQDKNQDKMRKIKNGVPKETNTDDCVVEIDIKLSNEGAPERKADATENEDYDSSEFYKVDEFSSDGEYGDDEEEDEASKDECSPEIQTEKQISNVRKDGGRRKKGGPSLVSDSVKLTMDTSVDKRNPFPVVIPFPGFDSSAAPLSLSLASTPKTSADNIDMFWGRPSASSWLLANRGSHASLASPLQVTPVRSPTRSISPPHGSRGKITNPWGQNEHHRYLKDALEKLLIKRREEEDELQMRCSVAEVSSESERAAADIELSEETISNTTVNLPNQKPGGQESGATSFSSTYASETNYFLQKSRSADADSLTNLYKIDERDSFDSAVDFSEYDDDDDDDDSVLPKRNQEQSLTPQKKQHEGKKKGKKVKPKHTNNESEEKHRRNKNDNKQCFDQDILKTLSHGTSVKVDLSNTNTVLSSDKNYFVTKGQCLVGDAYSIDSVIFTECKGNRKDRTELIGSTSSTGDSLKVGSTGGGGAGGTWGKHGSAGGSAGSDVNGRGSENASQAVGAERGFGNEDTERKARDGYSSGGSGGGGAGGGGGGGGGGAGTAGGMSSRKRKPDLKPMFHATLNLHHDAVVMTPDVYDVTATAFNMIHDMEDHLLNLNSLSSNPAFLPFTRPTVAGQTTVDDPPRGPRLDMILRRDAKLTESKNSVYQCVDDMFHCSGVYIQEMQRLYNRVFRETDAPQQFKDDVALYCYRLSRHDSQVGTLCYRHSYS